MRGEILRRWGLAAPQLLSERGERCVNVRSDSSYNSNNKGDVSPVLTNFYGISQAWPHVRIT